MLLERRMPALLAALGACVMAAFSVAPRAAGPAADRTSVSQAGTLSPSTAGGQIVPASPARLGAEAARAARVSGRLTTGDRPLLSAAVIMASSGGGPIAPEDAILLPDGTFTFQNVPPGRYEIRARGEFAPGGTTHFATFRVLVEDRDIRDLRLEMLPGATVTGTLIVETHGTPKPQLASGIRVRAPLADGSSFGDALTGEVQPDGSYAIRGLMSGTHVLSVEGLPDPWILKSVTYRGQDITDVGLQADARQQFDNVRVAVTDVATTLTGVVRNGSGRSVQDAAVFVIPLAQQFWYRTSRRLGVVRTDAQGRFIMRGLPAGQYRVVASLDVHDRDAYAYPVLERLSAAGVPLDLAPLEHRELDPPLTSPATTPGSSGR